MRIEIETGRYNERRNGRPWIARVDFTNKPGGEFLFGQWIGDARNGGEGMLMLDIEAGEIYARGQKDFRKPKNSAPDYYVVAQNGEGLP